MGLSVEEMIYQHCGGLLFPDPEYYEGRGNDLRDLNSSILELVYKAVRTEKGDEAARAFVNMVKNLKDTNAKSFLQALYKLERKGWRYGDPVIKVNVPVVRPAGEGESSKTETPAAPAIDGHAVKVPPRRVIEVQNAFRRSGSVFGHDKAITADFLARHKAEVEDSRFSSAYKDVVS